MIAEDVYERAIALIDEINPDTGLVNVDTTDDYKSRAPYLIDLLQKELAKTSRYSKVYEHEYTPTEDQVWAEVALPSDLDTIEKVVLSDNPDRRLLYYKEAGNIYVKYGNPATFRVVYNAIPPTITSLDDELVLDDLTLNAMSYGLAKKFIEVEQDDFLTSIFSREYEKHSAFASKRNPVSIEKMTNMYGGV